MDVWSDRWDQQRASGRPLVLMRRLAQEALALGDDDWALGQFARQRKMTVNEIVYYMNAYEYGEDDGLQAIRNPDIIPVEKARRAVKSISAALDDYHGGLVPCRVTDEGTALGVYQVQQRMSGESYLFPVCQFRLTIASSRWHLYWQRKFEAWWPHPLPTSGRRFALTARLRQLMDDPYGCFWG